ncbi:MAG: histidine kinase N-terminal 7TM domain-containing protein [Nitrospirales bacterium]
MQLFAISGLLNGLAAIGLAAFIYFRSPRDPRHWTFGLFGISTAIWSFGYFAWQISESETFALFNLRLLMAGAIFIPITFLHHVLYLLQKETGWKHAIKWNYIVGGIFLVFDATPFYIQNVQPISLFPYWGVPGLAFHFCLVWWIALVVVAHGLLLQAYLQKKGLARRQILYLLIGSTIGYVGGATNYPLWYGIEIIPYGTVGFGVYISIVAYTLLRFHWLDYSVYVEKGFSYFALLLLLSQPIYPVLLLAQIWVFGSINPQFAIIQLIFHLLTVVAAFQMKVGTKGAVARTIMKGRELRFQTITNFSLEVANIQSVPDLGAAILKAFGKRAKTSQAAIFSLQVHESRYKAIATIGFPPDHTLMGKGWAIFDDLPQWLLGTQSRLSLKELDLSDDWEKRIAQELEELDLELVYPIFGNQQLLGFLAFGSDSSEMVGKLGGKMVWDTLIQESALALENAILREENSRSENMLCQVDRLRSIEAMADGLTQELHNPLVSIKAFVQIAQLRQHDGEFMDKLHQIIGEDLGKIEELTQEIREYVKPLSRSLGEKVQINEVIDSCLVFVASNPSYHHILIEKDLSPHVPMIQIDRHRLMQAIFNGLLFLLKDSGTVAETLTIETKVDSQAFGKNWFQMDIGWKSSLPTLNPTLVSVDSYDFAGIVGNIPDPTMTQGVILAAQIIQRHFGNFRLLTGKTSIVGFQIQLPLNIPNDHERLVGSFPLSTTSHQQLTSSSDSESIFS